MNMNRPIHCTFVANDIIIGTGVFRFDTYRWSYWYNCYNVAQQYDYGRVNSGMTQFFDPAKTCSARPNIAPPGAQQGNVCHEGCEYNSSGSSMQPTGAVCAAPSVAVNPAKNNCCEPGGGAVTAGNPVNFHTGSRQEVETDYVAPLGKLELRRYYSNAPGLITASRWGPWRHSYARSLRFVGPTLVIAARQTADHYEFAKVSGSWIPDLDVVEQLSELKDAGGITVGWTLKAADDSVESYDTGGRLTRIDWPTGEHVVLTYVSNLLSTVTDQQGRSLTFVYSSTNLVGVKLPDGTEMTYGLGASDRLASASIKDRSGAVSQISRYTYGIAGITERFDAVDSLYATWEYDSNKRAIRNVHGSPAGSIDQVTFTYTANGTIVTDALGNAVSTTPRIMYGRAKSAGFDKPCPACNGSTYADRTFDVSGYPDIETDFNGNVTDWDYNGAGLVVKKIDAATSTNGSKRSTETSWHTNFRKPIQRDIKDSSNSLKQRQSWTYNTRGQVLTSTTTAPATSASRTTTYTYCEAADVTANTCPRVGLLLSVDGPLAGTVDRSTLQYYAADASTCASAPTTCAYRKGDLWKATNALGQITETLRYDGAGRVLSSKDANGVVVDREYHARGWLTATKVRGSNDTVETDDLITRIEYWPTGLVKRVTQADGAYTQYTYDQAHRLTDVTDNAGNLIHYTLDNAGNRIAEDTKNSGGTLKRSLSRVFNQLGQLVTQADAQANPTDFSYDANGNTNTVTDALSRVTDNDYDPLNRLARTLQDVGGIGAETKFGYDAIDNLVKVTDPKGLDTTYTYNGLGDLTQLSSPDTGITGYTYDAAGNRQTQTDARNVTATYGYDALGRLTNVSYPTSSLDVDYFYDTVQLACASGETFAVGRLTRIDDASGSTQYCYNRFGLLTRKVQTTNGVAFAVQYQWSTAGQLVGMVYPDGTAVDYSRNALGQVSGVGVTRPSQARQVVLDSATYHPFGPVAAWSYGNGRSMTRAVDQDYRPLSIEDSGAGGLSLGFGYDEVGNLTKLGTAAGVVSPAVEFGYDTLGRLTRTEDGPTSVAIDAYTYDATGNRLSHTTSAGTSAYTYPTTNHHLTDVGGTARSYDAVGNTTTIGSGREFVYSDANRMSQVKNGGTAAMNYAYNGRGEQVRRYLGTSNTYTVYDEAGHWLGDYDSSGAPLQQALWMDDLPVGLIANGGQLHYIEPDHLGSPRVVIEVARNVAVWKWDLKGEAFGSTAPDEDVDGDTVPFVLDMRFPGQRFDSTSWSNQNRMRDYESGKGRYQQSDLLGLGGGVSTYSYVRSSPMSGTDPLGLQVVPQTTVEAYCRQRPQECMLSATGALIVGAAATGAVSKVQPSSVNSEPRTERKCMGCKDVYPEFDICSEMSSYYPYSSAAHSLLDFPRGSKPRQPEPAIRGLCAVKGVHQTVFLGGAYMGSIFSCRCCVDTGGGPVISEIWGNNRGR